VTHPISAVVSFFKNWSWKGLPISAWYCL
jgi:hypothetical protein